MAVKRIYQHATTAAFASGGSFNITLSPVPMTITRIDLAFEGDYTTTTESGAVQDGFQRVLRNLNLSSPLGAHVNFSDMRPLHFQNKLLWPGAFNSPKDIGNSGTNVKRTHLARLDFGVNRQDPFDLTSGIPPYVPLTLSGAFGTSAQVASGGMTVNTASVLKVILYGMQPDPGSQEARPKAYPFYRVDSIQPAAATGSLGFTYTLPKTGRLLHQVSIMASQGSSYAGEARTDLYLDDIGIVVPAAGNAQRFFMDWKNFKEMSCLYPVIDDDGTTMMTPTAAPVEPGDIGVGTFHIARLAANGVMPYGADLRQGSYGDVQLAFGVHTATNLTIYALFEEHQLVTDAQQLGVSV